MEVFVYRVFYCIFFKHGNGGGEGGLVFGSGSEFQKGRMLLEKKCECIVASAILIPDIFLRFTRSIISIMHIDRYTLHGSRRNKIPDLVALFIKTREGHN